jgi:tetratricopeptide (TPR) repeat protein
MTDLWTQLRQARIFQFLIVYLGAAWVLIQILDIFIDNLGLPAWTLVGALALLVIGLVVILTTAWVQAFSAARTSSEDQEEPGAWDLAPGEIRDSLSEGRVPRLTWARALLGGVFAFALLFGFTGLYVLLTNRGAGGTEPPAVVDSSSAAPGIAVLPFTVSGTDLEDLRDGMVNLLSTNLDGAGGLRAIDSRTVFARWDELVDPGRRPDHDTNLSVARATGARYALLGSAVSVGANVRLIADVFEVPTDTLLGHRQVEGSPDSVLVLVDQLAVEVMGLILAGGGQPPSVKLSDVTTTSLDALKAFLTGESAYRKADFAAAQQAYEQAVAADSTFALAHFQLSNVWGWSNGPFHEAALSHRDKAMELVDRLPARQALLVQATDEIFRFELSAVDKLEDAVARYPDDALAWYLLGDAYFHLGARSLASPEMMDEAFQRAVELDPRFAPFRIHMLDLAFPLGDSTMTADRIRQYEDLAPNSQFVERGRFVFGLTYGDSAARAQVLANVDSLPTDVLQASASAHLNGCCWHAREPMLTEVKERGTEDQSRFATQNLAVGLLTHGEVRRSLAMFADSLINPVGRVCNLAVGRASGMPLQSPELDGMMALGSLDDADGAEAFCKGVYAATAGRWAEVERVIAHYEAFTPDTTVEYGMNGDGSAFAADAAAALRGFQLWKQGQSDQAVALVEKAFSGRIGFAFWLGQIYEELGQLDDAARFYAAWYNFPMAYYRLGKVSEQLGDFERSRRAYETFVAAWQNADPELQPLVDDAVQGILRVTDQIGNAE